ncbi:hypothetical protein [Hyphomonas oceanitis]|nr:hypothetical protein [Hyphomonas oceanitis]
MMSTRNIVVSIAICLASTSWAHSQGADEAARPQKIIPVYFLVDASGSMLGQNMTEAELLLSALSLPQDQLVSVTYFGGQPATPGADLCFETLDVPSPTRRGEHFLPQPPKLGGKHDKTAITNALNTVLGEVAGPAKIILITDGDEECDENFDGVRESHPNAEIQVRQVGNSPNAELQKLEKRSPVEPVGALSAPIFNLEFRAGSTIANLDAWALAGWYERRLWLFAVLGLLASAWLWGSSFGRRANAYEIATKLLEQKRREFVDKGIESEEQLASKLPELLEIQTVSEVGRPDAWRSVYAFVVAAMLGAPLIFFDFQYPERASWIATFVLGFILLYLLVFVVRKARPNIEGGRTKSHIKSIRAVPITMVLGLSGIGLVTWACWVDLGKAQGATWFVLSASLSAALAVSASAPLLFVGSKWWQFEMAKTTYHHTYTEAISERIREQRRNDKRIKDDWFNFRSQHAAWRPEVEFTLFGRLAQLWSRDANKAREIVVEKLRSIAIFAGGDDASADGKKRLEEFLDSRSVAKRIRSFLENDYTREKIVPLDGWTSLADALEKRNDRRIAAAYVQLAKSLTEMGATTG